MPPSPAPPVAPPPPVLAPAPRPPLTYRQLPRRLAKFLVLALLGYGVLWAGSAGGMLALTGWARHDASGGRHTAAGINHFLRVDGKVWRGSAPAQAGYRELARQGISTVVDLRAEHLPADELARPARAGITAVRLPIRDGQTPRGVRWTNSSPSSGSRRGRCTCTAAPASAVPAR